MMHYRYFAFVMACLGVTGWLFAYNATDTDVSTNPTQSFAAVEAMQRGLDEIASTISLDQREFQLELYPVEDGWFLVLTFLPARPSDEMTALIMDTGEVRVMPGL